MQDNESFQSKGLTVIILYMNAQQDTSKEFEKNKPMNYTL